MNKKRVLIVLLAVIIAAATIGYLQFNKPHTNYEKAPVDLLTNAKQLYEAFNTNETSANQNYLDKIIEIQGEPKAVQSNPNGSVTIVLLDEMMGVSCTFDSSYVVKNLDVFAKVKDIKTINIKGRCDGYLTDVRLSKCSFTTIE